MGISPYVAQVRETLGHGLLLLPSVSVLPIDDAGRVLLVREGDYGRWVTVGGVVEVDEEPEVAAVREAREEAGVVVVLDGLLGVFGGPEWRVRYPNGDESAYVTAVYRATVTGGDLRPDSDETTDVRWFSREQLHHADLHQSADAILRRVGLL